MVCCNNGDVKSPFDVASAHCARSRSLDYHTSRPTSILRLDTTSPDTLMALPLRSALLRQTATCLRQHGQTAISRTSQNAALQRLLSTLAVLEQREGKLNMSSLASISAAQKLGGSIHGFVAGGNVKAVAEEAAKVEGLEKVIFVDNSAYDKGLPENWAPLLVENIKKGGYTHVLAGHSAFGKNLMPRVAALLDVQQISDITAIEGEDTFVRPIYAGNAILTVQSEDNVKLITVRGTAFPSGAAEGGSASTEEGADPKVDSPTEWVSEDLAVSDRPDLGTAEKVVSGGRGLKSKEDFDRVMTPLADALGAAIGASRAAVDSGFADNSLQVGQTGKNVAPQLYLCAGISGAIQHLAGMKDSKVIAAINKDADAPIFQVADVGLVGDLFEKVPELTEKLKSS
nr:putative electron transfer flavoprotein subunit alpha, mitochondrial [Quercus suber]